MENIKESLALKNRAKVVALTILNQLFETMEASVIMSWGISEAGAAVIRNREGSLSSCLSIDVSGLVYSGRVLIALNEGTDTYEVYMFFGDDNNATLVAEDLYFDTLGEWLDEHIERPKDMDDKTYKILSTIDSDIKMLEDMLTN